MAIFGSLETVRAQMKDNAAFSAAMEHVERCLVPGTDEHRRVMGLQLDEGSRIELARGAFALEQCSLTKPPDKARWESHRKYADVQVVVSGDEIMEVTETCNLQLDEDLTPEKDLIFYQPYVRGTRLRAEGGFVAVFFPADAHRPSVAVDAPALVRKVVVKVPI